jgi:transposase
MSGVRIDGKVVITTELNLWPDFDVPKDKWQILMNRVEHILAGTDTFLWPCSEELAEVSQRIANLIREKRSKPKPVPWIDFDTEYTDPMAGKGQTFDGVAQVSLFAMARMGLKKILSDSLGPDKADVAMCLVAAKMERPASERATHAWLVKPTCPLGWLVGVDFRQHSHMELYRTSDMLYDNKDIIESEVYSALSSSFSIDSLINRYDLTNTYFEGNPKSILIVRGHSKDKRSNRPLISLGVVIDDNGYIKRSFIFSGNVNESKTLPEVIKTCEIGNNTIIIMDKGIATKENVIWLVQNGYKYIVANRERKRSFDPDNITVTFTSKSGNIVTCYPELTNVREKDFSFEELKLRCHSIFQEVRDADIISANRKGYEDGLRKLNLRCRKLLKHLPLSFVMRRIGQLDAKFHVSSHYKVTTELAPDTNSSTDPPVIGVQYEYLAVSLSKAAKPGVHSLRTNVLDLEPKEIWEAYASQNDVESVFRTLKSTLGLRPVHHSSEGRIIGHLFICTLAYQVVTWLRNKLKDHGIHDSWDTVRDCLADVNCAAALSGKSDAAARSGTLLPEYEQARNYFKAIGFYKPAKPIIEQR